MNEVVFKLRNLPINPTAYFYHQAVRESLNQYVEPNQRYLYRVVGDLIKVRAKFVNEMGRPVVELKQGSPYRFTVLVSNWGGKKSLNDGDLMLKARKTLEANGLRLSEVKFSKEDAIAFGKPGVHKLLFYPIELSGVAHIEDIELAKGLLLNGVLRGRAFGFGMLDLQEVKSN